MTGDNLPQQNLIKVPDDIIDDELLDWVMSALQEQSREALERIIDDIIVGASGVPDKEKV